MRGKQLPLGYRGWTATSGQFAPRAQRQSADFYQTATEGKATWHNQAQNSFRSVDDDDLERFFLRRALESSSYAVEEAETADDALVCCHLAHPDAIVADIFLPWRTGLELCHALRDEPATTHMTVVPLTGSKEAGHS